MSSTLFRPPQKTGYARLFEWVLLFCVIGILIAVFLSKIRLYQAEIEFGAFRSSLGAIRTALVFEELRRAVDGVHGGVHGDAPQIPRMPLQAATVAPTPKNPFLLLGRLPPKYFGEIPVAEALESVLPGGWFYDPACPCVGYRVDSGQEFVSASGRPFMVFSLHSAEGRHAAMLLTPVETYLWRGELIE